jgi:hypothetical protein
MIDERHSRSKDVENKHDAPIFVPVYGLLHVVVEHGWKPVSVDLRQHQLREI